MKIICDHQGPGAIYIGRLGKLRANLQTVATYSKTGSIPFPVTLRIDPSTACDQACTNCTFASAHDNPHPFLARALYRHLIKEAKTLGVRGIVFSGGGEPTLHPQFTRWAEQAYCQGFEPGLITNLKGTALKKGALQAIVKYASWIRISLLETDFLLPPEANQTKINLARLFELRRASLRYTDWQKPDIGFSVLVDSSLCPFLPKIVEMAAAFHPDYLQLKPMLLPPLDPLGTWNFDPYLPVSFQEVKGQVEKLAREKGIRLAIGHPAAFFGSSTIPQQTHCHAAHFDTSLFPDPSSPSGFSLAICCEQGKKYNPRFSATGSTLAEAWENLQPVIQTTNPQRRCNPVCVHSETNYLIQQILDNPEALRDLGRLSLSAEAVRHGAFF